MFGTTGAVVGASKSNIESETVEQAEIIIRLVFTDKEPFEILTCNSTYETGDEEWRDVLDQAKILDEYFKELIGIKSQNCHQESQSENENLILALYEDYKKQYNCSHLMGIVPKIINEKNAENIAYTSTPELKACIASSSPVSLYYSEQLFKCPKNYIKAILYHEFTHISDFYFFIGCDNIEMLMSTYSEFNAMRTEFTILSEDKKIKLDDEILNENSVTTPRIEIEGYLEGILLIIDYPKEKISEEELGLFTRRFIRYFSWMFGILYLYEKTDKTYFASCFQKLKWFENKAIDLYQELKRFDNDKAEPQRIVELMWKMYCKCFNLDE